MPDPYTSEPLVLPRDVDVAVEPFRPEPAERHERFARAAALTSAVGFGILAALPASRSGAREPVVLACLVVALVGLLLTWRSTDRTPSTARTAVLVLVESTLVLLLVVAATESGGAASAVLFTAAVSTAAASLWVELRHARWTRRGEHDAAHDRRVEAARAELERAHAWNDLLAARRDTGGTVWWVESVADDGDATVAMVRQADDGGPAVAIPLEEWVPAHVWVVLDAHGDVAARTPPSAPEDWRSVLTMAASRA